MNCEDIIRMARKAGIEAESDTLCRHGGWVGPLERFAALVAAAEREACAKVAEALENRVVISHPARVDFDPDSMLARRIAALIKAKGDK